MAAARNPRGREIGICERCEGPLAAPDGHYHSSTDRRGYPQFICCGCAGHDTTSFVKQELLAQQANKEIPKTAILQVHDELIFEYSQQEQDILEKASKLGQFSISKLWEAVSPERKDSVWYTIKDFLEGHPELFEQASKRIWKAKIVEK